MLDSAFAQTARIILLSDEIDESTDLLEILDADEIAAIAEIPSFTASISELRDSTDRTQIEYRTQLALSLSLCPFHLIDYAICFDDKSTDCYQIRLIHPLHDT